MHRVWRTLHHQALVPHETIYALSTPPGKAGIAVFRISGPAAPEVWRRMVKSKTKAKDEHPTPLTMERCGILHPTTRQPIDDGLAVFFKSPKSFTTEHVLELHTHSGRAILSAILSALRCIPGCRPAEPGEFARRAFENGRLDLTRVQGLKDLIDAETEEQRRSALRVAEGSAATTLRVVRGDIVRCLAQVQASIDFGADVEDEESEMTLFVQAQRRARDIVNVLEHHLHASHRGEVLRKGIQLAIYGPPNAGKSTLFNVLAQREASIVTPYPGTTRDVLEVLLDLKGVPVRVADTAGIHDAHDEIEKLGIGRAHEQVRKADVTICVLPLPEVVEGTTRVELFYKTEMRRPPEFVLFNKADLLSGPVSPETIEYAVQRLGCVEAKVFVASLAGSEGVREMVEGLSEGLRERYVPEEDDAPIITREWERFELGRAVEHLREFVDHSPEEIVFAAEHLQYASNAVGKVMGEIGVEEVLDSVFRDFCIGK